MPSLIQLKNGFFLSNFWKDIQLLIGVIEIITYFATFYTVIYKKAAKVSILYQDFLPLCI